jgi:hypothetical protein
MSTPSFYDNPLTFDYLNDYSLWEEAIAEFFLQHSPFIIDQFYSKPGQNILDLFWECIEDTAFWNAFTGDYCLDQEDKETKEEFYKVITRLLLEDQATPENIRATLPQ